MNASGIPKVVPNISLFEKGGYVWHHLFKGG
jgi:hypothetical protein